MQKTQISSFPHFDEIKSGTVVISSYSFSPQLQWKMKVPNTVFFQLFPLEFLSLLFSIPYFFTEIALFNVLKIHGTQFSLEHIGPKAFNYVYIIAWKLPLFKRFMNLESYYWPSASNAFFRLTEHQIRKNCKRSFILSLVLKRLALHLSKQISNIILKKDVTTHPGV